jgi:pilus assembly protein Flp/PilA
VSNAPYRVKRMKTTVKRFVRDEPGATAIEYCLIATGISVVIISIVKGLGTHSTTTFTSVSNDLK